ncbi:VOC family protein [Aquirhabdus sp.]|uniref:VOC family protein n=1 Tax=Aquirhabdus sp. TaxID=2824160 RepID=UPI00396CC2CB
MELNIYLSFKGQCEEAFNFYAKVLGGTITMKFTHKDSPMAAETAPEWLDKIMHMRMNIGQSVLMGADMPEGHQVTPQGFNASLQIKDPAEAERVFAGLAENGTIHMPIAETFWAQRFGMLVDQFGIPWMINCEKAM